MEQEQFVGFDVSQAETPVCVVDGSGKVVWQGKCVSTPEAMAATVRRRAPHVTRIALETGPMSAWHYRSLTARRGSNQGNTQNEKSPYYQSSIDFRCYLEMALFEPRH